MTNSASDRPPGAVATSATDAAARADIVILAAPLSRLRDLPLAELDGKIVVDAMNYWPPVDGIQEEYDGRATSPLVAEAIPGAAVVKSFRHFDYHQLDEDARPGAADRRAIALAGDDHSSVTTVADPIDRLGFDPVIAGPLQAGSRFGPGSNPFGVSTDRAALERLLGIAAPPLPHRIGSDRRTPS